MHVEIRGKLSDIGLSIYSVGSGKCFYLMAIFLAHDVKISSP